MVRRMEVVRECTAKRRNIEGMVLNSAATSHMCKTSALFSSYSDTSKNIRLGDDRIIMAKERGSVPFNISSFKRDTHERPLYAEPSAKNLISIPALTARSFMVTLKHDRCHIINMHDKGSLSGTRTFLSSNHPLLDISQ
jgi:hypothetical protein